MSADYLHVPAGEPGMFLTEKGRKRPSNVGRQNESVVLLVGLLVDVVQRFLDGILAGRRVALLLSRSLASPSTVVKRT